MAKITVHSNLCGFVHHIEGHRVKKNILITIETPCQKVGKLANLEVPIREMLDIKENYVLTKAQEAVCCSNCLVPCSVLNLCRYESGYIAQSLWEKTDGLEMIFEPLEKEEK